MSIMTAIMAAATAMEVIGGISKARSEAKTARFNAALAEMQARQVDEASRLQQYRLERQRKAMMGRQRALYAKAGVTLEGSPLEVLADTEAQYELDKQVAAYNAQLARNRLMYQGQYYKGLSRDIMRQAYINAGGTILSTAVGIKGFKTAPKYGSFNYWKQRGLASRPPKGFETDFVSRI